MINICLITVCADPFPVVGLPAQPRHPHHRPQPRQGHEDTHRTASLHCRAHVCVFNNRFIDSIATETYDITVEWDLIFI